MKRYSMLLAVMFIVLSFSTTVFSAVINTRPITTSPGDLTPLQTVFTGIGSSINVYTDQSPAAIFEPTGFGFSSAAIVANVSWSLSTAPITFGIYSYGNPGVDLIVSPSGSTIGYGSVINFNFLTGTVSSYDGGGLVDTQAGFFAPGTVPSFGFFITQNWTGPTTLYSEDSLNNGNAQALFYEAKGNNVSLPYGSPIVTLNDIGHWYLAWEALPITDVPFGEGARDYNDYVIQLESVKPVPEPGTMMLLGSGLIGLAGWGRKKFRK